ncbi:MAG: DUF296 domain-containing protein [Crenarchaeota archaeon]|nr:DUF296 domain-containing protein [Thermoproteota archaeon]
MVQGKLLGSTGRVIFLRLDEGARLPQAIDEVLEAQNIGFAMIQGIGGLRWARVATFSPSENKYYSHDVEAEQGHILELLSLSGNSVFGPDNTYYTHLHVTLSKDHNTLYAGHLIEAEVSPLAEIFIIEVIAPIDEARRLLSNRWKSQ